MATQTWTNFTAPNLGLLFYKQLYTEEEILARLKKISGEGALDKLEFVIRDKEDSPFDPYYDALCGFNAEDYEVPHVTGWSPKHGFTLITTYPGVLVGSGYDHQTKSRGDASIGFYFDHVTGLPTVPGSSVKGLIQSAFMLDVDPEGAPFTGDISLEFINFCAQQASETSKQEVKAVSDVIVLDKIKNRIFGIQESAGEDVFFDTQIITNRVGDNPLIAKDFITPHKEVTKNPVPIQFLKVPAEVPFEFRFGLSSDDQWSAMEKEQLFKQIVLELGVGAKTNVGYGRLEEDPFQKEKDKEKILLERRKTREEQKKDIEKFVDDVGVAIPVTEQESDFIPGEIVWQVENRCRIEFEYEGYTCLIQKTNPTIRPKKSRKQLGDKVLIKVREAFNPNEKKPFESTVFLKP